MQIRSVLALSSIMVVVLSIVYIVVKVIKPWELFSANTVTGRQNRYIVNKAYKIIANKIYDIVSKVEIVRVYIDNKIYEYRHRYVIDTEEAKLKVVGVILIDIIICFIALIGCIVYFKDMLLALITSIMIVVYVQKKKLGNGIKFLEMLEELLNDMVHLYNAENQNIDRMFNRLLEDKSSYMFRYVEQMYTYLKKAIVEADGKMAIAKYNNIVASRYLRLIFNYIYITYRYGDCTDSSGEQLFSKNILSVQREVHYELMKLKRLRIYTFGEQIFIILAVGMIPVLKWLGKKFVSDSWLIVLGRYLSSSTGQVIELVYVLIILSSFYLHTKFMGNIVFEKHRSVSWEGLAIRRIDKLREGIEWLISKVSVKDRERIDNRIILSNYCGDIRDFYLRKILSSLVVLVVIGSVLIGGSVTATSRVRHGVYGDKVIHDSLDLEVVSLVDRDVYSSLSYDDKVEYLNNVIGTIYLDGYGDKDLNRIYYKVELMDEADIKLLVLMLLICVVVAYKLPDLDLWLGNKLNARAIIDDEVNGYYILITLLINHPSSNATTLLNWIANFASIFKQRIRACVASISNSEIDKLEEDINYKPFSRLLECIRLAYNGVEFKSAFIGIEQMRSFQEDERKLIIDQVVEYRVKVSRALDWIAICATCIVYLIIPMWLI